MGRDSRLLGNNKEADETYTPVGAVSNLFPFLQHDKVYYEATSEHSSTIMEALGNNGYMVVGNCGVDFFECTSDDVCDAIVTNPPYSIKDKFIEHCYNLGKPFALLLPVAAFQGQKRGTLFKQYGISALVYNSRVDFTGKGAPTFGVAWFMGNGFSDHMKGEDGRIWFV